MRKKFWVVWVKAPPMANVLWNQIGNSWVSPVHEFATAEKAREYAQTSAEGGNDCFVLEATEHYRPVKEVAKDVLS